jgi:hypothetical protein
LYLHDQDQDQQLHTKMNPTSYLFGLWFVYNPFFLLAGALIFDEKIRRSVTLCGMLEFLQILFSQDVIQRPIVDFPAFLETGLAEKIPLCDHTTRDPNK